MIKRKTIELMQQAFHSTKYKTSYLNFDENNHAYALFDGGVDDGIYLSEDFMFCLRWEKMGGKCFVDITIDLTHIGVEHYSGSLLTSIFN
jgi:hypothetical protein